MKRNFFHIFCVSILCFTTAVVGFAQQDRTLSSAAGDLYLISAKAGVVNYVQGRVAVQRSNGTSGYLVKGDLLEAGDRVSTDSNSRAEVLMNPGSFVRLKQNSEFEFETTTLDDLKLKVTSGSAIFEVYASDDFKVTVNTTNGKFYLVNTGVYRVDVLPNGVSKLEVHRGKAQVGSLSAEKIKKGRMATIDGSNISVAKFNRKDTDAFEDWSKSRAKLISKAGKKLSRDRLSNSLLSRDYGNSCFDSFGLWVFSPRYSSYSFLPFGYGWRSPYGHRLSLNTGICNYPYNFYRYPRYRRYPKTGGSGTTTTTTTTTTTAPAANIARGNRNLSPPFARMGRNGSGSRSQSARRSGFPSTRRSSGSTSRGNRTTRSTRTTRRTSPRRSAPARRSTPSRPPLRSSKKGSN